MIPTMWPPVPWGYGKGLHVAGRWGEVGSHGEPQATGAPVASGAGGWGKGVFSKGWGDEVGFPHGNISRVTGMGFARRFPTMGTRQNSPL